ncbi:branched-chain amino acid transport system II carrier protein [Metabacillus iocasae]|uniref:Branched-chain amino acid transport system carrier protein n=1 Tax=Priestia iocasae TaxID=2291674 RepID=A0ABS2QP20_9BACI|nr:branched-chain amino acid transport system II carrier protein [Metabacillus iocasae]MBM7701199.1 LIVCS family branched-chain amino acid:cation transporter [Metabacillus iocasae]
MNKKTLTKRETFAIGLMLFALFFGAGNMIFPPALGQEAGTNMWSATLGFLITGVGLPLMGVIAISKTNGDFTEISKRVNPIFGILFTIVLYLAIGPLFGIPRTGTVAFEIGLTPFLRSDMNSTGVPLALYTVVFFGVTLWLALNPTKIVDRIGKVLTPLLLGVLALLVIKSFITPMGSFQAPEQKYTSSPFTQGFIDGYLTMDTIAALVFGIVIITAIKEKGIKSETTIASICVKAGIIAAVGLVLVYLSLAYIGASSVEAIGLKENGGSILTSVATYLFGSFGTLILALAITFACLTTSIGLTTACGRFFTTIFPSLSYKTIVVVLTIFSAIIANVGLTQLIQISVPILVFIYPIAIILIVLSFIDRKGSLYQEVYVSTVIAGSIVSLMDALKGAGMPIRAIDSLFEAYLPLYSQGIGWIVPTIIAAIIGYVIGKVRHTANSDNHSKKAS